MHFKPLLGKHLKDDELLDVLECYDMTVVYDFDRLHENIADKYWASSKKDGLQFRFTEDQTLDTVFLYVAPLEGFSATDLSDTDLPLFNSIPEAETYCANNSFGFVKGEVRSKVLGECDWARVDAGDYSIHYTFIKGGLSRITLMMPHK